MKIVGPFKQEEITRRSDESNSNYFARVFNNLPLSLVGSHLRQGNLLLAEADIPNSTVYLELGSGTEHNSKLYLGITHRMWYEMVDEACLRSGYSLEEIRVAVNKLREVRNEEIYAELSSFLTPVYIELRKMGFSKFDIWG